FLSAAFTNNVGYVGYENQYLIPQGLLIGKSVLLACFICLVFWKRKLMSVPTLFITLWMGFSFYNMFFSQRPYTHYVLVFISAFTLGIGLLLELKQKQKIMLGSTLI